MTNGSIRSWSYFPSYFTSHIWSFRYPHQLWNAYRPTLLIWLRLNDVLFGPHVWGWHLSLVAAHVAVTYLVYRLIARLTRDPWIAAAGALVFGLHPVHTETDSGGVVGRPAALNLLCARHGPHLVAQPRGRAQGRVACCLNGSVRRGVTFQGKQPDAAGSDRRVCMDLWRGLAAGKSPRPNSVSSLACGPPWARQFPTGLRSLLYMPLRIWALKGFAYVITPLSLSTEIFTIPSVLLFYLRLLIWPSGLSCYYDTPYVSTPGWHDFVLPVALLAAVAAAMFLWYWRTRQSEPESAKVMAFACLWMVLTVLPVLNFRFLPEGEIAHDRYLYLPSVGFALLVAIALRQAVGAAKKFCKPAWVARGGVGAFRCDGYRDGAPMPVLVRRSHSERSRP